MSIDQFRCSDICAQFICEGKKSYSIKLLIIENYYIDHVMIKMHNYTDLPEGIAEDGHGHKYL